MNCYRCGGVFADDQPFYNDYDVVVCKPCFLEGPRCFVCRFPGKDLREVAGLGLECEFCRGKIAAEGDSLQEGLAPIEAFLTAFGCSVHGPPQFAWIDRRALRDLQTEADLPQEAFMDDFLRFAYPVFYREGTLFLLRRMRRSTLIVHTVIQLAVAHVAGAFRFPNLAGKSPFHAYTQGWCHWVGYEAAQALKFDQERRQLRRWPELGMQGDFERWEQMSRVQKAAKTAAFFHATVVTLGKKHLASVSLAYMP